MPFVLLTHHKCASTWLITYRAQVAAMNGLRFGHMHRSEHQEQQRPGPYWRESRSILGRRLKRKGEVIRHG